MLDYDMAILNFLATFSGVGFAFFLTLWYDHSKKENDEKEFRQRMLTTIRKELQTNVEILGELDKNKLYGAGQMFLWRDGYQSAVNGGGISLLDPRIQTQLGMLYLQFKQLDVYGGKLLALLGLPFTRELEIVLKGTQVLMEQSMKSALLLIPKGLEVIDAELKQLSATSKWKFWGARQTSTMSPSQGGLMDKLHYRYEWLIIAVVIESIILDWLIFQQFSEFTRLPVISSISGVFVTVEGILIGLSPQIKVKWSRDFVAAGIGVPALLTSVAAFAVSTYQTVQLSYSSANTTTYLFQTAVVLFLLLVEFYALAIVVPFARLHAQVDNPVVDLPVLFATGMPRPTHQAKDPRKPLPGNLCPFGPVLILYSRYPHGS